MEETQSNEEQFDQGYDAGYEIELYNQIQTSGDLRDPMFWCKYHTRSVHNSTTTLDDLDTDEYIKELRKRSGYE